MISSKLIPNLANKYYQLNNNVNWYCLKSITKQLLTHRWELLQPSAAKLDFHSNNSYICTVYTNSYDILPYCTTVKNKLLNSEGWVGGCLVKLWRTQQQNVLGNPHHPLLKQAPGCVRKYFLLLWCLSQQKITLIPLFNVS